MDTIYEGQSFVPGLALPVAAAIAFVALVVAPIAARRARRRDDELRRAPGDERPGPARLNVQTVGAEPTNFGHSQETESVSGTPTLDSAGFAVCIVGGPLVAVARGTSVRVLSLGGAKRRLVDTTTTSGGGVTHRYSFDVPPKTAFWITGVLVEPSAAAARGPQPAGDAVLELAPRDGSCSVSDRPALLGPAPLLGRAVGSFLVSALGGSFVMLFVSMGARTGCASGEYDLPSAALADTGSFGLLVGSLALFATVMSSLRSTRA